MEKKLKSYDPKTERTITTTVPIEIAHNLKIRAVKTDSTIQKVVAEILKKELAA